VNKVKSALTAPLPSRFIKAKVTRVRVVIAARHEITGVTSKHQVRVNVKGLPCGVYPIVIDDWQHKRSIEPVLRIWSLVGGHVLQRAGFPFPISPPGLS
jgi:hypothetical protein